MEGTGVYRVNGNLAVSRAVGDVAEKPCISAGCCVTLLWGEGEGGLWMTGERDTQYLSFGSRLSLILSLSLCPPLAPPLSCRRCCCPSTPPIVLLRTRVLPEPEVRDVVLDQAADQFLIVATDGLWDVMSHAVTKAKYDV